jgi:signal transduction histidine kinase
MTKADNALTALSHLSAKLASTSDKLTSTLKQITDTVCETVNCAHAALWLANNQTQTLALGASNMAQVPDTVHYGCGAIGAVAEEQRSVVVANAQWDYRDDPLAQTNIAAMLGVPLMWRGKLYGVLAALDTATDRIFSIDDRRLMNLFATQAAAAIAEWRTAAQSTTLEQSLVVYQERLLHLQVAIRQMLDESDMRANLREVAEALQALGWRRVILALYGDDYAVEELVTLGLPEEEQRRLQREVIPAEIWEQYLAGELEERRLNGLYYVPVGQANTWQAGDLLFAPLQLGQRQLRGMICLDEPVEPVQVDAEVLRPVDILISQAAYIVENLCLLEEKSQSAEELAEQVEELSMIHRADRELSAHLNVDRVMTLTMDWALRRTMSSTGVLALISENRRGLVPLVTMGHLDADIVERTEQDPWPLERGIMGYAVRTGKTQIIHDPAHEHEYMQSMPEDTSAVIAVPLSMRGEILGVIMLASRYEDAFAEHDVSFLERLARRAAVALDNARLYRQSEQLADDMAVLYSASRAITSTLEQNEVLQRIAQSMAVALECSSAVLLNYLPESREAEVLAVYRVGTATDAPEVLPEVHSTIRLDDYPALGRAVDLGRSIVLRLADPGLSEQDRRKMEEVRAQVSVLAPLMAQGELIGLAIVNEGRRDRVFSVNEIFKTETLASQASVALRQAMLHGEVLELEKIKSEMIRMASHDLRNPLNNTMGFIELVAMSLDQLGMTPDQAQYIDSLRRSTRSMKTLIDDLLTLERVESERKSEWVEFDLAGLVAEVVESARPTAELKNQTLTLERQEVVPAMFGSVTQLRQALANLVGNAIKYTPDEGQIEVCFSYAGGRLQFAVEDNGYGISPERQARLFERFYRAQEPGTDDIPGTGLGLSLVRTVVERHGGDVWFESEPGVGSTFGFWLPGPGGEVRS